MYKLNLISTMVAQKLNEAIPGIPSMDRILIASPKDVETTVSGIIIPDQVREGVPRKGVVIKQGFISEENNSYKDQTEIGRIITYGLYAGKEIEFDLPEDLKKLDIKFSVISLTEVIYTEPNNVD